MRCRMIAVALVALWGADPALAQKCDGELPQQEMNRCAQLDYEAADKALNAAYRKARAAMRQLDADVPADLKGAEIALRDAQRAWITYRDKACIVEGYLFRGGTMEPFLVATCKAHLTKLRTQDLLGLVEQ